MASMKMEDVQHVPLRNHPITQRWPVCSLRGIKSYLGQQREALPELDVRAGGGGVCARARARAPYGGPFAGTGSIGYMLHFIAWLMKAVDPFHLNLRACAMDWRTRFSGSRGEHVSWVAGRAHSFISLVLVVVKTASHFTATRWAKKVTAV